MATRSAHAPSSTTPTTRAPTRGPEPFAAATSTTPARSQPGRQPASAMPARRTSPRLSEIALTRTIASARSGAGSATGRMTRRPGASGSTTTARLRRAVADVVKQQVETGVDVVNDGEQGKVGYSTYVRHRLTGFGGQSAVPGRADWADFPEAAARSERRSTISRPACDGPIEWK